MSKAAKTALAANVLCLVLISIVVAHAQRPPELDDTGAAYLRVNINPTNVPPMVNINPNNRVPAVDIANWPAFEVKPSGCGKRENFLTGVGRTITGPMMVTYLHLPDQTRVTLGDPGGSHSMNLGSAGQITTAIYLGANQRLEFSSEIMYSGCRPD